MTQGLIQERIVRTAPVPVDSYADLHVGKVRREGMAVDEDRVLPGHGPTKPLPVLGVGPDRVCLFFSGHYPMQTAETLIDHPLPEGFQRIVLKTLSVAEEPGEGILDRDDPSVQPRRGGEKPVGIPVGPPVHLRRYPLLPARHPEGECRAGVGDMEDDPVTIPHRNPAFACP